MKFSIVTTFYNNTIDQVNKVKDSILNQSYTKWEWVVSDDFSNENKEAINVIKNLPKIDKRIKYVEQKSKKEIYWNPQTYASGNFVMKVDSDDYILPKTLEVFNYHFLKYPELILITSESDVIIKNEHITPTYINYVDNPNLFENIHLYNTTSEKRPYGDIKNGWLYMGYPLTWRNLNINFIEEFKNFNNNLIINDYIIHIKLEELGNFLHIPRIFYKHNIRNDSVSRKIDKDNDFTKKTNDIESHIKERRKGKEFISHLDIYDEIIYESRAFYFSKLNKEKVCQNVCFITLNDLKPSKRKKIKELYIDHIIFYILKMVMILKNH